MQPGLLIYGAYGYTGKLIVEEALNAGLSPILAGRSKTKLTALAEKYGLPIRAFDVDSAGDYMHDVGVVLNCAGPFSKTSAPLVNSCLRRSVHYVDITGELDVFQSAFKQDAAAKQSGIVLCPGAGFDIVPTDCLAASLAERLPDATTINLAFSFGTRPSIGTLKTAVENVGAGGMIRRNHNLATVANGYRLRKIDFPSGKKWSGTMPWGDVFTAGISSGVPNGMVYAEMPLALGILLRVLNPIRAVLDTGWAQRNLRGLVERYFPDGPDATALASQRAEFWGEAVNDAGQKVTGQLSTQNVYALTAEAAVQVAKRILQESPKPGFATPSMLFGADFITSLKEVERTFGALTAA